MCIGEALFVEKWTGSGEIPDNIIDDLHEKVRILLFNLL
jgi:hypothetical protein